MVTRHTQDTTTRQSVLTFSSPQEKVPKKTPKPRPTSPRAETAAKAETRQRPRYDPPRRIISSRPTRNANKTEKQQRRLQPPPRPALFPRRRSHTRHNPSPTTPDIAYDDNNKILFYLTDSEGVPSCSEGLCPPGHPASSRARRPAQRRPPGAAASDPCRLSQTRRGGAPTEASAPCFGFHPRSQKLIK